MSRGVLAAATLMLSIVSLAAELPAQADKVTKLMDSADAAYDKGRYEDAFEKYQKAHQESGGAEVAAILGALEASFALGRYDGIITQVSGSSSDDADEQAQLDSLVGRAHLLTAYVVDPTASPAERAALAMEHRKRALARLTKASAGSGDWAVRSDYYLAEAKAVLGDTGGAREALDGFFGGGGDGMPESRSATELRQCIDSGSWVAEGTPAKVLPSKTKGPAPRRAADGASILAAVLTADGQLSCMRMIPPLSDRANEIVYETLARWSYSPAESEAGEAIAVPYTVTLDFTAE